EEDHERACRRQEESRGQEHLLQRQRRVSRLLAGSARGGPGLRRQSAFRARSLRQVDQRDGNRDRQHLQITRASRACRRVRRQPLLSSSAAPLAISAPPTKRRNARSLSPVWMRLPMKIPASIIGNAMATVISTSRVYSPTAQ